MKSWYWPTSLSLATLPVLPVDAIPPEASSLEPVTWAVEEPHFLEDELHTPIIAAPEVTELPAMSSASLEMRPEVTAEPDNRVVTLPEVSPFPEFSTSQQVSEFTQEPQYSPTVQISAEPTLSSSDSLPADNADEVIAPLESGSDQQVEDFIVFPVGFNVDNRPVVLSVFVRGREDLVQAVAFERWLLPFEDVMTVLQIEVTPLDSGEWELRSPGVVVRLDPNTLKTDPEIGLAIEVDQIQTLLGVSVEFDIEHYAVNFSVPWSNLRPQANANTAPINLEGLPEINAPTFTAAALGQSIQISGGLGESGSQASEVSARGNLALVGTILGGSWFFRINQGNLFDYQSWRLAEAQYLRQTENADYVIGSQSRFWPSQETGGLWGFTTVQRWGVSPTTTSEGGFAPRQRLQARQVGQTISGVAPPGTLVRLVDGFGDRTLDEILVDDSGTYRFANIPIGGDAGNTYRILLYPDGQLTAEPEVREASFSTLTEQLTQGSSALILSAGLGRALSEESEFWGEFTNFQGGIAYRYGLSEELTLGLGAVLDQSVLGLGELYYQPRDLPLYFTASTLFNPGDQGLEINSRLYLEPAADLSLDLGGQLKGDRLSGTFNLNWQALSGLSFAVAGNSETGQLLARTRFSRTSQNSFTFATFEFDTQNSCRWSLNSRFGQFGLSHQGSPTATTSALSYGFTQGSTTGHALQIGYETQSANDRSDRLASINWRYRSPLTTEAGQSLWEVGLGYGIGSRGSGFNASAAIGLIPGLTVRLRYQDISLSSDTGIFRIELLPRLNIQSSIRPGQARFEQLRNQGGIILSPFFDQNHNQQRDPGEALYTENSDLLFRLNNRSIRSLRPNLYEDGIYLQLAPGNYRLDIDPAGFPIDWQAQTSAYAVEVVAGSYTTVPVPLSLSYTLSGIVTDSEGNPVGGAKVEAIATAGEDQSISITNGAGVFFLEGLQQGTYRLMVNGDLAEPNAVTIGADSEPFQELNLQKLLSE